MRKVVTESVIKSNNDYKQIFNAKRTSGIGKRKL